MAALLKVEKLSKRYGTRLALDGLSFHVERGDILAFLGPNGAGKTTTFALLSGLLRANSGTVHLLGQPLSLESPELRRRMGVAFQHASVDPKLTTLENLLLGGRLYGLRGEALRDAVGRGLQRAGLIERRDDLVETLSGGMRRRLELARTLLHEPEILLLDEPTQGLDLSASRALWQQLLESNKSSNLTILLTTHNAEEAEHANRLLLLDRGKTLAHGTPSELRSRVAADVIRLTVEQPEPILALLTQALGVTGKLVEGDIAIEAQDAHALLPRVLDAIPKGLVRRIEVRRASLADVFVALTGVTMSEADNLATPAAQSRRGPKPTTIETSRGQP